MDSTRKMKIMADFYIHLSEVNLKEYIEDDSTLDRNKKILERLIFSEHDFIDTLDENLQTEINESDLINLIRDKQREHINNTLHFNYTIPRDTQIEDGYKELLDDLYGEINICGHNYQASEALHSVDPIAYRCGLADYESDRESELNNDELEED